MRSVRCDRDGRRIGGRMGNPAVGIRRGDQAAATCFKAWLKERGGIGAGEDQAAIGKCGSFSRRMAYRGSLKSAQQYVGVIYRRGKSYRSDQTRNCNPRQDDQLMWLAASVTGATSGLLRPAGMWKSEVCRGYRWRDGGKGEWRIGVCCKRDGKNLTRKVTIAGRRTPPRDM